MLTKICSLSYSPCLATFSDENLKAEANRRVLIKSPKSDN